MPEIIGLGYVCVDLLGIVPRIPGLDEGIMMLETARQQGGLTATAMVAAARLGASVGFMGAVGDDDFGKFNIDTFRREGVNTDLVLVVPGGTTAFSFVLVDKNTGKRTIVAYGGVHRLPGVELKIPDFMGTRFLHLDGAWREQAIKVGWAAKGKGIEITLDPSSGDYSPTMVELLRLTDYAIPPYQFAKEFTGLDDPVEAGKVILRYGPKVVTITRGEHGSVTVTRDGAFETPAFKVPVIDTTGAGDTFHGAFVFALNKGYDLETTVLFASAVAALKCTKMGGQAGLPTFPEVQAFLSQRGIQIS